LTHGEPRATDDARPNAYARIAVATFWAAALVAYLIASRRMGLGPLEVLASAVDFLTSHPSGPWLYVAAYVVRPLFLFSATVLTVGAGYLYGPWWGFLIVVVGANAGAMLAYAVARWLGGPWTQRLADDPRFRGVPARLRRRTFETILILRFTFAPYDAVNYLAGALRLKALPFLVATAVGSVIGTVTFLAFGASLDDLSAPLEGRLPALDARWLAASVALFAVSWGLSFALRRRSQDEGDEPTTSPGRADA